MSGMRGFLSILRWPERSPAHPGQPFAEEDGVAILADAAGLDPYTAKQAVRRGTPQVADMIDESIARAVLGALRKAGVTAAFVPERALEASREPLRAKRLMPALGAPVPMYAVEPWRGEGCVLRAPDILLLVRASLLTVESRTEPDRGIGRGSAYAGYALGGVHGAAIGAAMDDSAGASSSSTTRRTSEMLDVHLRDGSRVRIDGDKFCFDVLGVAKGMTDRANMDSLAARLRREAPGAAFDGDFRKFSCPPQYLQRRSWGGSRLSASRTSENRAFDFYSAWLGVLSRAAPGAQK